MSELHHIKGFGLASIFNIIVGGVALQLTKDFFEKDSHSAQSLLLMCIPICIVVFSWINLVSICVLVLYFVQCQRYHVRCCVSSLYDYSCLYRSTFILHDSTIYGATVQLTLNVLLLLGLTLSSLYPPEDLTWSLNCSVLFLELGLYAANYKHLLRFRDLDASRIVLTTVFLDSHHGDLYLSIDGEDIIVTGDDEQSLRSIDFVFECDSCKFDSEPSECLKCTCAICLTNMHSHVVSSIFECTHVYHKQCIVEWRKKVVDINNCPECRSLPSEVFV